MSDAMGRALDRYVALLDWFGVYEIVEGAVDWIADRTQR